MLITVYTFTSLGKRVRSFFKNKFTKFTEMKIVFFFYFIIGNRKQHHSSFNKSTAAFHDCDFQIEQWRHTLPEIRRIFCR